MRRRAVLSIVAGFAVLLAVFAIYVVDRSMTPLPLPAVADIEERLGASVAAREPLETVLDSFWQSGFACTEIGDETGTWTCDLAEGETGGRPATEPLECPMRVMVSLQPDASGRLTGYAVSEGAFCM